jgi:hypothetical protein
MRFLLPGKACVVLAGIVLFLASPAMAFKFTAGELDGGLDITLGYGASYSTEDGNTKNYTNNKHFDAPNYKSDETYRGKGIVMQVWKVLAELDLEYKDYGFKSNASFSYDTEMMDKQRNYDYDFDGIKDDWSSDAEDASGKVFNLLDAYVYGNFLDDSLDLRVGRQVINWGEGLVFMDGVSVQVPFNINNLVLPGSELKEAYMGLGAVRAQIAATDTLSFDAYWQWEWEKNMFPGTGTFYGDDILASPGAEDETLAWTGGAFGFEDRDGDVDESNQWGVSATSYIGNSEYGIYYSRYNDAMPSVGFDLNSGNLFVEYAEDQDMYGISMATSIRGLGAWTVNTELSYRPDRRISTVIFGGPNGIGLNDDGKYWTEADTWNASVHGFWLGKAFIGGIDSQFAFIQIGVDIMDYDGDMSDLQPMLADHDAAADRGDGVYEVVSSDEEVSSTAWGIAAEWDATWQSVLPAVDVTLALFGQYDFAGNSHLTGNFSEGRLLSSVGLSAVIHNDWETGINYARTDYSDSNYEVQNTVNFNVNYKF